MNKKMEPESGLSVLPVPFYKRVIRAVLRSNQK